MDEFIEWKDLINCYKTTKNEDQKIMYLNLIRELASENIIFAQYASNNGVSI